MNYFKLCISCGHVGRGNEVTVVRYFQAVNIVDAYMNGNSMPRAKNKRHRGAVKLVVPVSEDEYLAGKISEQQDPYLELNMAGQTP
ncbi:MAG: hypothetical protein ACM3ZQ_04690 [Bacillota bacterium]